MPTEYGKYMRFTRNNRDTSDASESHLNRRVKETSWSFTRYVKANELTYPAFDL